MQFDRLLRKNIALRQRSKEITRSLQSTLTKENLTNTTKHQNITQTQTFGKTKQIAFRQRSKEITLSLQTIFKWEECFAPRNAGGKPSTWIPPDGFAEWLQNVNYTQQKIKKTNTTPNVQPAVNRQPGYHRVDS